MKVESIALSRKKGTRKTPVYNAEVIVEHGLMGDAHGGSWHRQVSLLAAEEIENVRQQGLTVGFGDFAENIATSGIDWTTLPLGTKVAIGTDVRLEITQIGKKCEKPCAIFYQAGDCIMPRKGVFARVLAGGVIKVEDAVQIISSEGKRIERSFQLESTPALDVLNIKE